MTDADRVEPVWLDTRDALAIHDRQLAEHGGGEGVRDQGLLESALAKPVNRWNYGEDDFATLAAAYTYGVARNHPFIDGNKRTAWVLGRLFLAINDKSVTFDKVKATQVMMALAAGDLTEKQFAEWLREHIVST